MPDTLCDMNAPGACSLLYTVSIGHRVGVASSSVVMATRTDRRRLATVSRRRPVDTSWMNAEGQAPGPRLLPVNFDRRSLVSAINH